MHTTTGLLQKGCFMACFHLSLTVDFEVCNFLHVLETRDPKRSTGPESNRNMLENETVAGWVVWAPRWAWWAADGQRFSKCWKRKPIEIRMIHVNFLHL